MLATLAGMAQPFQPSLLDLQDECRLLPLGESVRRTVLTESAWIDTRPGWLAGADELFDRLARVVQWRAERRPMYERVVDVPRLLSWYSEADPLPDPLLLQAKSALNAHYRDELGEDFATAGLCL
jgi:alkylated DNA repair dioxygenase AlkB